MPNRILKESICTSEEVDKLSPLQETVFYRLIVNCDDFGRCDARAKILKSKLFPLKDIRVDQIEAALEALSSAELVILYEVDGKPFLQMKTWDKHQRVRAKVSKYPAPADACCQMTADDSGAQTSAGTCARNPIQSNPNPNPKRESTRTRKDEEDDGFTAFWDAYPRKSGDIRSAYMEYLHVLDSGISPETLIEAIKQQTKDATSEDLHFLPGAEKWLRNRGWESKAAVRTPPKNGRPAGFTTAAEYKAPAAADINALQDMINRI